MASSVLQNVMEQVEQLTPDEQLRLIAHLAEKARQAYQAPMPRRKWREIRGAAPYPLLGEDAQAWVSRTRKEGDEHREQELRREP